MQRILLKHKHILKQITHMGIS